VTAGHSSTAIVDREASTMKIVADRDRCEGHGLCADVAPEVYELDDDAIVVLVHELVPPALERKAEAGARVCPVAALRVEQSTGA
jgi:ferredoxin